MSCHVCRDENDLFWGVCLDSSGVYTLLITFLTHKLDASGNKQLYPQFWTGLK